MNESGIVLELPGGGAKSFRHLVLDYTGTLSLDGGLLPGVGERLTALARKVRISVLTADTFGQAEGQLRGLPVTVRIIRTGQDKADIVTQLGPEGVIAVGNGRNDVAMMKVAGLGVAVIGPEGVAGELLAAADIIVTDIHQALDLLTNPLRVKATLRG